MVKCAMGHAATNRACFSSESDVPIARNLQKYMEIID